MAANCWGESYGIDAWGNLNSIASLSSAYTGCAQEPGFSTTANARNQLPLTGNAYDSAGNVITAPVGGITNSYSYNADNQMLSMTGLTTTTNYVYDGDGKRVQKTGSKLYWYGADGAVLDETDTTGSVTNANFSEYIFVGGRRMARRDSAGNVLYYFADHLGTSRTMAQVASGQTTATLCYDADFYPFGGERTVVNLCGQNYKFTGKERDQESGLDEFGARYYASAFGRFTIPDWAEKPTDVPYANFGNPQSLNLYSYVQNNPTTLGDPDGHQCSQFNQSDPCQPPPKPPAQNQQTLSSNGLQFIERHEGYSGTVYKDSAGNPTIGYGHLLKEGEGFSKGITKEKAGEILSQDTKTAVDAVNGKVTTKLSQTKFDAVVDFTFNLGGGNLGKSTLLKNINAGSDVTKGNFTDWNHAGGKVVNGLTTRRTDEFNLFSKGDYGGP